MVLMDAFMKGGDVYIDYPYEDVKFRLDKAANKVYQRWYGGTEMEIPHDSELFHEGISAGKQITREDYFRD